ncbi:hypothetical protein BaRGS_00000286 [Batillaria attramentaria]|uniref:Protrudin n=1 Tax=Batillaria attramentaria TaxID=370345 RepID=A0ABD0MAW1_9CAEN
MGKPQGDQDKDRDTEGVLDLANFVIEVERFSSLVEPFAFLFYTIDDIRRWRFPNSTIAFWLVANICCFVLTQGAVFILASCLVIAVATISLCQLHTRILDKYLPKTKLDIAIKPTEETNNLETIQNFQYSLIQMHDFVIKCNEYLSYVYAVLKWDDTVPAVIYHTEVCVSLLCFVVFPIRWNCFLFFNWFFLCHPMILKSACTYWVNVVESFSKNRDQGDGAVSSAASATSAPSSETSQASSAAPSSAQNTQSPATQTTVNSKTTTESDNLDLDDKDDASDIDLIEMSNAVDESLSKIEPPPARPGMVARLLELKRRRTQMASENCFGCKVSFSSILKRRHYCRHCGNGFCHKCCNQKVPRSVFGATSPAAAKETVLVCNTCHALLTTTGDGSVPQGQKPRAETS